MVPKRSQGISLYIQSSDFVTKTTLRCIIINEGK